MTLAMLHYVSAIFNALYTTLWTRLGFYSSVTNVTYVLASGQEILAENRIVLLVLKSQRNVTYSLSLSLSVVHITEKGIGELLYDKIVNSAPRQKVIVPV